MKFRALVWMAGLATITAAAGCDDDPVASETGSIEVTVTTTGAGTDADGYDVTVGTATEAVDADDTVTFDNISTGNRAVTLSDIADNCEVDGDNPVTATVEEDETEEVSFAVTCAAA